MKAALVGAAGATPVFAEFAEPQAREDVYLVEVTAAALSQLARARASGQHYSSRPSFPFVPGVDGVGRLADGRRVYFAFPEAPFGSMAEKSIVPASRCVVLPDGLDDVTAAAIANPGMSSWAALTERAQMKRGETVLINGATGSSGRLAVQIAKHMGAAKIVATGRNAEVLASLKTLGADVCINLTEAEDVLAAAFEREFGKGVNIVLDYLWGRSAEIILTSAAKAAKDGVPARFVQVGSISGGNASLPAAVFRSSGTILMGSGIGSIPLDKLVASVGSVFQATLSAGLTIETRQVLLADIEHVWAEPESGSRIVFTVNQVKPVA